MQEGDFFLGLSCIECLGAKEIIVTEFIRQYFSLGVTLYQTLQYTTITVVTLGYKRFISNSKSY